MRAKISFGPAKRAKLGPTDLARILKLNRVTVSLWLNGHTAPHQFLEASVKDALDAVQLAVEAGELPVPHTVERRLRHHYIQTVMDKHKPPVPV